MKNLRDYFEFAKDKANKYHKELHPFKNGYNFSQNPFAEAFSQTYVWIDKEEEIFEENI